MAIAQIYFFFLWDSPKKITIPKVIIYKYIYILRFLKHHSQTQKIHKDDHNSEKNKEITNPKDETS